ncbi:clostripain-related cysteine peptidase [Dysgonomonas sp. ZJ709]|uniref:clostripain-related cysteine peptidase n=1 Tax=Dysgonomonas sp. ZJ709 TaxID=2709797 RepID=UPI0021060E29|nr:clostripain-related cysteine peptidase [Dysgonomonas sp. ZJ709]
MILMDGFNKIGLLLMLLCILLFSCSKDGGEDLSMAQHVLLVYIGGDNSLSDETYQKIESIRSGWKAENDNKLLIYSDASDAKPLLMVIVNQNGKNVLKTVNLYMEEDSAYKETLARVIGEVKNLYPYSPYGLLVFSHASGWLPPGTLTNPQAANKSVLMDGISEMDMTDFANAIPDGTFDYIVFEACFMAGIEVAYELKDKTDYILASSAEILSPGFTEVYPQIINKLFDGDLKGFAQTSFEYFNTKTGWECSATFSIIKTSALGDLSDFVSQNCDLNKEINVGDIQYFDRYGYHLFFDFEQYYASFIASDTQREEFKALIDKCVVWKSATPHFMLGYSGFAIEKYSGLTVYVEQEQFSFLNAAYKRLAWYQAIHVK